MAIWPDAYYFSLVMFKGDRRNYLGPTVCALGRQASLRGADAALRCQALGKTYGPVLAASLDGETAPAHNILMSVELTANGAGRRLFVWRHSFTANSLSAASAVAVAPFVAADDGLGGRLSYRQDGGREAIVATHTVRHESGAAALRWYELRISNGTWRTYQQGTQAPDRAQRWRGAIAMDRMGNIALAYNAAGADKAPGVRYTGRQRSGAPGRMDGEETIVNGNGVQLDAGEQGAGALSADSIGQAIGGDDGEKIAVKTGKEVGEKAAGKAYAGRGSLVVDPVDGCTFWSTQQYVPLTGRNTARTRIAAFRFDNCR